MFVTFVRSTVRTKFLACRHTDIIPRTKRLKSWGLLYYILLLTFSIYVDYSNQHQHLAQLWTHTHITAYILFPFISFTNNLKCRLSDQKPYTVYRHLSSSCRVLPLHYTHLYVYVVVW